MKSARLLSLLLSSVAGLLVLAGIAWAHSVAQVQTTKFFAPETVQLLKDRALAGSPGFQVGDIVSYIIQFSPVENANGSGTGQSNRGTNGYVTDYIPSGTQVVGAWIVSKDASGNYNQIPPSLPGGIDDGWGTMITTGGADGVQQTYASPFNVATYDPTGYCSSMPTLSTRTFTAGTNWTAPAGTTWVQVEAWGGGGAGGGETTNAAAAQYFKGGGGAGGQYAMGTVTVTPGNTYAIVVGAGGTGSNGDGTAGGDSTFNATDVVAKGGAGGQAYENGGAAGAGSTSSGIGDTVYAGGSGSNGGATTTGGAGGGGAGDGGNGGDASGNTAGTGTATGGGNGGAGRTTAGNGNTGTAAGGGGGGAYTTNSNTNRNGGAGARGQVILTYYAPGSTTYTNNCNSRLTAHVADTGIFYSTDPRTSQYPQLPMRIQQSTNGYNINPTGAGQLNPIIGQTQATVHNLWDADQTNAFGTATLPAAPRSSQSILLTNTGAWGIGYGAPPFFAGSPVAGPQTGYQLDCTANVGPWQRIAYSGSRIGDISSGPATGTGNCLTCVNGSYTSSGWNLSASNPLPSGTNAVRWAIGRLTVGEQRYVKISLRLTSPLPSGGLINGSEVFGGDTADSDDGAHNTWRYMVPSVADNNSNLFVVKTIACVYSGGTCTTAYSGDFVPANAKIRYRVIYLNAGNATQSNVNLTDTLPCQTAANPVSNINIISGPIGLPSPNPPVISAGTNATTCASGSRRTFMFPQVSTMGPGEGGAIEYDVQTNAAANSMVPNTATLYSSVTSSVTSNVTSYVQTQANLLISKTASVSSIASGGTFSYTITVQNTGTANATNINVYDILPTSGGTGTTTRFSFVAGSSAFSGTITPVTPTMTTPPSLTPYNTGANQEQVQWNFGAQTLAPGASFTITFAAIAGSSVPASATPYTNSAAVQYTYTGSVGTPRSDAVNVAGVSVTSALSVAKSIECYYSGGSCVPYAGSIPANALVRYRIDYANTGSGAVANAVLSDTLPCQTGAAPVSSNGVANTVNIVSGPVITIPASTLSSIAAGYCGSGTRRTFSFPAVTINAGQTGVIKYDLQTTATTTTGAVINTAALTGTATTTVTSDVQTTVNDIKELTIAKSASATTLYSGQTITYTLTITSTGTATATNLKVYDWLPTSSPTLSAPSRFSFVNGSSSFSGIASATTASAIPPTQAPYSTGTNAANQQEVVWDFGSSTLAPGASFSVIFGAIVGSAVTPGTYYANYARVVSGGTTTVSADSNGSSVYVLSAATPTVDISVTKTNASVFLASGGTTTYTITVTNNGPNAADTTVVRDVAVTGLAKTGVTCVANGLASCPTGTWLSVAALEGGAGIIIPTFASGGQVVLAVPASVTATGGYITNAATANPPSALTDTNSTNNTSSATNLVMLMPQFTTLKSSVTTSDPYNGTTNPKAIPGATKRYSIQVTNNGTGTADSNSIFIADAVPANMTAIAGSATLQPGGDAGITGITVTYTNAAYNAATHPMDRNFCSTPNAYSPPSNVADPNIAGICIVPTGQLSANGGTFTVSFDAVVN